MKSQYFGKYSGVRVISSRILHEICLLIGELAIRGTKLTLNARLGTENNLLLEQLLLGEHYCMHIALKYSFTSLVRGIQCNYLLTCGVMIFQFLFNIFRVTQIYLGKLITLLHPIVLLIFCKQIQTYINQFGQVPPSRNPLSI